MHVTTHVVCLQLLVPGQTRAFLPRPHASVPRTSVCLFRCGHVMSQAHTYDWTYWVMVTVSDSGEGAVCLSPLHVLSTPAWEFVARGAQQRLICQSSWPGPVAGYGYWPVLGVQLQDVSVDLREGREGSEWAVRWGLDGAAVRGPQEVL